MDLEPIRPHDGFSIQIHPQNVFRIARVYIYNIIIILFDYVYKYYIYNIDTYVQSILIYVHATN